MTQIFIRVPFATAGDKTAVPEPVQAGGEVSLTDGFPIKYSQDPNTTGLRIERENFNWLVYMMTTNLRQYQTESAPQFITAAENGGVPFPYGIGAVVYYGGLKYQSKVAANVDLPTVTASWVALDPYNRLIERDSPVFTGAPLAPTPLAGDNSTKLATTAFVAAAIAAATPSNPLIKARVNFTGTGATNANQVLQGTPFNVSSVYQENDSGVYTINFSTPMPDTNYSVFMTNTSAKGGTNGTLHANGASDPPLNKTLNSVTINFGNGTNNVKVGQANIIII